MSCGALGKLAESVWVTRKSTLLNRNATTVNSRENRVGKYLKSLKYSTASLYWEPALGLPFGQNLRCHLCSIRPWGSDNETLVVYSLLLGIYSPSMTTWICSSTCWGTCIPIRSHCLVWVFVPALVFHPIWDFIFCMLLLELDTYMTIICLSANSWNVKIVWYKDRITKKFLQTVWHKFSPVLRYEKMSFLALWQYEVISEAPWYIWLNDSFSK